MTQPLVALTIAGTDSSGGAGVHADLRTFTAHGLYGASAIAAVTAQNTRGVQQVHVVPSEVVAAQIDSVTSDLTVAAVKTGMLASAETIEVVAERARRDPAVWRNLVVDPVMVSSSGDRLLDRGAEDAYRTALFPLARVLTPNTREAAVLVGRDLPDDSARTDAARELADLGPELVVITGGDADEEGEAVDIVVAGGQVELLAAPRIATANNHGSGCTFASAVASRLALGDKPLDAIRAAKAFVTRALHLAADWHLGSGHGPLDQIGAGATAPSDHPTTHTPGGDR